MKRLSRIQRGCLAFIRKESSRLARPLALTDLPTRFGVCTIKALTEHGYMRSYVALTDEGRECADKIMRGRSAQLGERRE